MAPKYEFAVVSTRRLDEHLTKDLDALGQLGYHVVGILAPSDNFGSAWPRIVMQRTLEE